MGTVAAFAWRLVAALALALGGGATVLADDLPGRVGRLADVAGRIYLSTEQNAADWLDARRNDTVTSGDNLWVAGDGRAEIDYGGGQVRLAGDTNVHVARLDDAILALFVAHGRVIVRVRVLDAGEAARIDTPNTQLALTRPGLYRIDVSPDRTRTEVVVREGEATVSFPSGLQQVLPGQTALVDGAEPERVEVRSGFYVDGFDTWSADRDRRYERSRSAAYVSRQMIGYADLDDHGRWETVPEYGPLWYPSGVVAGWAPYRYGRWAWVGGWGWTWVDDAPWGYAPFHYGRWVHYGGAWAWAPGAWVARPLWSPAMVAWYGGSGWSYSVTVGAPVYGWVPLAWGEPFIPWWGGCSRHCWSHYNRPYAVNLAEKPNSPPVRYANWSAPGGVTAVPGATFTGRKPVHNHVVDLRPQALASAPVLTRAPVLDKPAPGRIPDAQPPRAAPLPASAFQTKPMRLPPSPTVVRTEPPAALPGSGVRTGTIDRGPGVTTSVPPGLRPPNRAPLQPGTWGPAATAPAVRPATAAPPAPAPSGLPPAGGTLQREPRVPAATPPSAGASTRQPALPRAVAPAIPPAVPGTPAPLPRSVPPAAGPAPVTGPAPAPVPRAVPPAATPVPAVPPAAPPPVQVAPVPGAPAAAPPGGRGGTSHPVLAPDASGRVDPPGRPIPR